MTSKDESKPRRFPWVALACAMLVVGVGVYCLTIGEPPPQTDPPFKPERYIRPREPIVEITVRPRGEAEDKLHSDELVLGITVGDESRAYPINQLNHEAARKVLNDTLGGRPIVVTWCDMCNSGIVYSRVVGGRTLTFAVSGQLWKKSLVMYDRETRSLWSQLQGKARVGAYNGTVLELLPSVVTDWQTWSRTRPESTVAWFDSGSQEFTRELYDSARFVLGIAEGGRAKAWSFTDLLRRGAINDTWAGEPVVAVMEPASRTARLYLRKVAGRTLTFRMEEGLTDRETGTTWEPVTGTGVSGSLAGESLSALPAVIALREVWLDLYPRSQ